MSLTVRGVIKVSGRLLGWLPAGDEPGADDAADSLIALNRLKRAMFGTVIGPRLSPIGVAGPSGQAESGGEYQIPGGAAFTLTAPANPRAGARFGVVDAGLAWGAYPLTIRPNGRLINGAAGNLTIAAAGANGRWWFRGDTGAWVAEGDWSGLDAAIEFPDALIDYLPNMLAVVTAAEFSSDIRPEVMSFAIEGRLAFARAYGRRGAHQIDAPLGLAPFAPMQGAG